MSMQAAHNKRCHAIIHGASALAGGVGFVGAQLPTADNVVLVPLQIGMILSLGAVFGIQLTESAAKTTLATATATLVGRGVSQWAVGWVPLYGNIVNASTAAAVTEGIGWAIAQDFARSQART